MRIWNITDAGFDGAIGWPDVRDDILAFDPIRHTIVVVDTVPKESDGWLKFKIHSADSLRIEIPLTSGRVGDFSVDTGAPGGLTLPPTEWKAWRIAHPNAPSKSGYGALPGIGSLNMERCWADEVSVGPLKLTDVSVALEPAPQVIGDGLIGLYAMARMDIILDGKNGYAYLRPKPAPTPSGVRHVLRLSEKIFGAAYPSDPVADWTVSDNVRVNPVSLFFSPVSLPATAAIPTRPSPPTTG
jgi:hypothetical protein